MFRFLLPIVILLVFTLQSNGQISGTLDNSFHASASFGPNCDYSYKESLFCTPTSGDRFFVAGYFDHFSGHATKGLARVFADGTVDPSFKVSIYKAEFQKIIETSNGKILAWGSFRLNENDWDKTCIRLNENGSLDPGFTLPAGVRVGTILNENDEGIYLVNNLNYYSPKTIRLHPDGSFDSTFITDPYLLGQVEFQNNKLIGGWWNGISRYQLTGRKDTTFHSYLENNLNSRCIPHVLPNGKIWVASLPQNGKFSLKLLAEDGMLLNTLPSALFNSRNMPSFCKPKTDGSVQIFFMDSLHLNVVMLLPNGQISPNSKIIFQKETPGGFFQQSSGWAKLGFTYSTIDYNTNATFTRYNSAGQIAGIRNATGFNGPVTKVVTQKDGKILVFGGFTGYDSFRSPYILRLLPDGFPDTSFHSPFQEVPDQNNPQFPYIQKVNVANNGKILLQGYPFGYQKMDHKHRMIMLLSNGSIDTSFQFDTTGLRSFEWGGACLMPNQKMYLKMDSAKTRIFRYHLDGSRDLSFSPREYAFTIAGTGTVVRRFTGLNEGYSDHLFLDLSYPTVSNCSPEGGDFPPVIEKILKIDMEGALDTGFSCGPIFYAGQIIDLKENQKGDLFASLLSVTGGIGYGYDYIHILPNGKRDTLNLSFEPETILNFGYKPPSLVVAAGNNTLISLSKAQIIGLCADGGLNYGMEKPWFTGSGYDGSITGFAMADSTHFYAAGTFNHVGDVPVHSLVKLHYQNCLFTDVQLQVASPKKPVVYPNPGSSEVRIQFPYSGNWQSRVFDAQGKPTEIKGNGAELSVLQTRQLPTGLYYIRIWDRKSSFLVPWMKQ
ncbi:MAG TPA: T9SS type A sorting domain-containing protein [Catalimonadaceae bacterium]|nr:T9SS type A sorting domain-containing protein [Catalimonadaceae bacterium]